MIKNIWKTNDRHVCKDVRLLAECSGSFWKHSCHIFSKVFLNIKKGSGKSVWKEMLSMSRNANYFLPSYGKIPSIWVRQRGSWIQAKREWTQAVGSRFDFSIIFYVYRNKIQVSLPLGFIRNRPIVKFALHSFFPDYTTEFLIWSKLLAGVLTEVCGRPRLPRRSLNQRGITYFPFRRGNILRLMV